MESILPPEESLIQKLLNHRFTTSKHDLDVSDFQSINWKRFTNIVKDNRLEILLYQITKTHSSRKYLPKHISEYLLKADLVATQAAQIHHQTSKEILKKLSQKNIPFIVLKTFPVSSAIHPKTPIKTLYDLDILVTHIHFATISSFLKQQGYHPEKQSNTTTPDQISFIKDDHCIEIHLNITNTHSLPGNIGISSPTAKKITDDLIKHRKQVNVGKTNVYTFTPDYLVISLFLHAYYHHTCQSALIFYEVAAVCKTYQDSISFPNIHKWAKTMKMEDQFFWFLMLLDHTHPTILPNNIKSHVHTFQTSLNPLQRWLLRHMIKKIYHPIKGPNQSAIQQELTLAIIANATCPVYLHLSLRFLKSLILNIRSQNRPK